MTPIDAGIPLSVQMPHLLSPLEAQSQVGQVRAQQQEGMLRQGQMQLQQQQGQMNALSLSEGQIRQQQLERQLAGAKAVAATVGKHLQPDGTVDHAAVAADLSQQGFPEQGDAWLAHATATAEATSKLRDLDQQHQQRVIDAIAPLAQKVKSAADFDAMLGQMAIPGVGAIKPEDAAAIRSKALQLGPDGWKTIADNIVQQSSAQKSIAMKMSEPTMFHEGDVMQIPATGQVVGSGAPKPKNEWESFQNAYAHQIGVSSWDKLPPSVQLQGLGAYAQSKQDPAMRQLAMDLKQMQLGQQPTKEDAESFADQLIAHKLAPSQVQLFGGFGAAGAAFKRMIGMAALRKDSNFDWEQSQADYDYSKSPGFQSTVRFMDSVTESIPRLITSAQALGNGPVKLANTITNLAKTQINDQKLKAFVTDTLLVSDEVAKILQGGGTGNGTSDAKLKQAQEIFNTSDDTGAITSAANEVNALIGFRKKALTKGTYLERQGDKTKDPMGIR